MNFGRLDQDIGLNVRQNDSSALIGGFPSLPWDSLNMQMLMLGLLMISRWLLRSPSTRHLREHLQLESLETNAQWLRLRISLLTYIIGFMLAYTLWIPSVNFFNDFFISQQARSISGIITSLFGANSLYETLIPMGMLAGFGAINRYSSSGSMSAAQPVLGDARWYMEQRYANMVAHYGSAAFMISTLSGPAGWVFRNLINIAFPLVFVYWSISRDTSKLKEVTKKLKTGRLTAIQHYLASEHSATELFLFKKIIQNFDEFDLPILRKDGNNPDFINEVFNVLYILNLRRQSDNQRKLYFEINDLKSLKSLLVEALKELENIHENQETKITFSKESFKWVEKLLDGTLEPEETDDDKKLAEKRKADEETINRILKENNVPDIFREYAKNQILDLKLTNTVDIINWIKANLNNFQGNNSLAKKGRVPNLSM